jgi:hypothetical protein
MRGVAGPIRLRILGIDPTTKGFAYALLEGADHLVDYGGVQVTDDAFGGRIAKLIDGSKPDVVVVESPVETRRQDRARKRIRAVEQLARRRGVNARRVTRDEVGQALGWKGTSKYDIAQAVTRAFRELLLRLPPRRKFFNSEDDRMNLFDAVSFALTFFEKTEANSFAGDASK